MSDGIAWAYLNELWHVQKHIAYPEQHLIYKGLPVPLLLHLLLNVASSFKHVVFVWVPDLLTGYLDVKALSTDTGPDKRCNLNGKASDPNVSRKAESFRWLQSPLFPSISLPVILFKAVNCNAAPAKHHWSTRLELSMGSLITKDGMVLSKSWGPYKLHPITKPHHETLFWGPHWAVSSFRRPRGSPVLWEPK